MCLFSVEIGQWQSLRDVLRCLNCPRTATTATQALITDWARDLELACQIWSSLSVIPWLASGPIGQPLSGKWLLILVGAIGEMKVYIQLSKKVNQIYNFLFLLPGLKSPQPVVKVFRLPEFPPPLAYHYVQNYYSDMVASLGKAINAASTDESALLARYSWGEVKENNVSTVILPKEVNF